jgi:hypothetical protein
MPASLQAAQGDAGVQALNEPAAAAHCGQPLGPYMRLVLSDDDEVGPRHSAYALRASNRASFCVSRTGWQLGLSSCPRAGLAAVGPSSLHVEFPWRTAGLVKIY